MKNRWQEVCLKKIGNLERGKGLQKSDFAENGIPCIHYGQIFTYYGGFTNSTISFVSPETAKNCTMVYPGDVVLTITSENVQDLCKSTVWLGKENIVTGGHSGIFRHNQSPKFIGYYFESQFFQKQKAKYAKGTKVIEINPENILNKIKIILPDLETQKKIVAILEKWDAAIENLKQQITEEKKLGNALYKNRMKRLLANGCPIVKLGDISSSFSGGTPNSKNTDYYGGDIAWVSISDMTTADSKYIYDTSKHLTVDGMKSSSAIKLHPAGAILFAMYASIGECVIAGRSMASSQAILGIECSERLNNEFLFYYLINKKTEYKLKGQQGTQSNLNAKIVRNFNIPLPNIAEQIKLVRLLNAQDQKLSLLRQKLANYEKQRKYLLNRLLSGKEDI